jgi:hypothetical protein
MVGLVALEDFCEEDILPDNLLTDLAFGVGSTLLLAAFFKFAF